MLVVLLSLALVGERQTFWLLLYVDPMSKCRTPWSTSLQPKPTLINPRPILPIDIYIYMYMYMYIFICICIYIFV